MTDWMIGERDFDILSDLSGPSLFDEFHPQVAGVFHGDGSDALGVAVGSDENNIHLGIAGVPLKSDRFKGPDQVSLAVGVSCFDVFRGHGYQTLR